MNFLDAESIRGPMSGLSREQLDTLEVFAEIESTNSYLMAEAAPPPGRFRVALAEHQTAGRGSRDRVWYSPPSTGLCLSMSYTFRDLPESLPCLTLAIGVGVAQVLEKLGVRGVGIKWPNDIVARNGKLGGILTEVRSMQGNTPTVVVGVGINVDLKRADTPAKIRSRIGHVTDLASCLNNVPSESDLSARLIEGIFNTIAQFDAEGFHDFFEAWPRFDWLRGQHVCIESDAGATDGICQGIENDGALILRGANGRTLVRTGSVQLHRRRSP